MLHVQLRAQLDFPHNGCCILLKREASHQFVFIEWFSDFTWRIDLQNIFFYCHRPLFLWEKREKLRWLTSWPALTTCVLITSAAAVRNRNWLTGSCPTADLYIASKSVEAGACWLCFVIHGPHCLCVFGCFDLNLNHSCLGESAAFLLHWQGRCTLGKAHCRRHLFAASEGTN